MSESWLWDPELKQLRGLFGVQMPHELIVPTGPCPVQQRLDQALSTVRAGDGIGAVAVCTRLAIDHFLSDWRVGVSPSADGGLVAVVSALRSIVQRAWMPDLDEVALLDSLAAAPPTPVSRPAPKRRADRALRYAPLANAELLELGLSGQAGKAVEGHAAFARKELAELDAIIARHEESRNARLLTKLGLDIDEQTRELGEHLTREQREYCAAAVRLEQLARHALSAYPPFAIYDAAGAALGTATIFPQLVEPRVLAGGVMMDDHSSHRRAAVGLALCRLREVVAWAFPGALGPGARPRKPPPLRRPASPYRSASARKSEKARQPALEPHSAAAMLHAVTASRARQSFEHALPYLASLGCLVAADQRAGRRWREGHSRDARSHAEAADRRRRRAEWQRSSVFWMLQDAHQRLAHTLRGNFRFELWRAIRDARAAILAISTDMSSKGGPLTTEDAFVGMMGGTTASGPRAFHLSVQEVLARLRGLADLLQVTWGLPLDMDTLIADVAAQIPRLSSAPSFGPPPLGGALSYPELTLVLARSLAGTRFVASAEAYRAAAATFQRARAEAARAGERVTLWDKLNLVTDSPAERERDDWKKLRNEQGDAAMVLIDELRTEMLKALAVYPPALAYFALGRVCAAVLAVRIEARRGGKYSSSRYEILGHGEAHHALAEWTAHAISVFGPILTPGDWLAESVCRTLADLQNAPPP